MILNKKECPEQDSNLHASRHTHLKRARLPIPPPGHFHMRAIPCMSLFCSINGAENGTRTRDPNLGKVVLYQLSYFRIFYLFPTLFRVLLNKHFSKCDAKVRLFSETTKLFTFFFQTKYYFYISVDLNQSYLQFSTNETKFLVNCHSLDNIDIFNTQGEIHRNPHTPLASSYGNKTKSPPH